jgi:hypothetical protein
MLLNELHEARNVQRAFQDEDGSRMLGRSDDVAVSTVRKKDPTAATKRNPPRCSVIGC